MKLALAIIAVFAICASVVQAQAPEDDWDFVERPDAQLTMASLDFGNNLIAVRCREGVFDVIVTGIPATSDGDRTVRVSVGAIADEKQIWLASLGRQMLSSPAPGRLARQMRGGGTLNLLVDSGEISGSAVPRRYRLDIPSSPVAIDRVLAACDQPLRVARDPLPRTTATWLIPPRVGIPQGMDSMNSVDVNVKLSCLVGPAGRPTDCEVLQSNAPDKSFDDEAMKAVLGGRLQSEDMAREEGRVFEVSVLFNTD